MTDITLTPLNFDLRKLSESDFATPKTFTGGKLKGTESWLFIHARSTDPYLDIIWSYDYRYDQRGEPLEGDEKYKIIIQGKNGPTDGGKQFTRFEPAKKFFIQQCLTHNATTIESRCAFDRYDLHVENMAVAA
jgi:hypothetical protein